MGGVEIGLEGSTVGEEDCFLRNGNDSLTESVAADAAKWYAIDDCVGDGFVSGIEQFEEECDQT